MTIFLICAVIASIGIVLSLFQVYATRSLIRKSRTDEQVFRSNNHLPPVSILKPLRGLDDNLFDNLSSFCTQDYPEYEILFALQDHNDPAYKVVKKVQEKHRDAKIMIVIERCNTGLNPKINNLVPAYHRSAHPYILISDSNVMVGPGYLRDIVGHTLDQDVGLVSNVIRGVGGRSFGAKLENLHLNSFVIGSVSFLDRFLGMPCVVGKSMLMKKADFEALGGFQAFKDILAEDFIIGREMAKTGKKVALSNYLINNVNEFWDVKRFLNRHTRWGKLRWRIGGFRYFSEILANPFFAASIPLFTGPSKLAFFFAGLIALVKITCDMIIGGTVRTGNRDGNPLKEYAASYLFVPIKDFLIGLVWFVPLVSATVVWRGNRYLIGHDSRLSPCPETGFWSWGYRMTDYIRERVA